MDDFKERITTGSVVVLGITAIAYVAAFIYEISYLSVFGVDWRFAQVQIPVLITGLASVGFALFMVDYLFTTLAAMLAEIKFIKSDPSLHRLLLSQAREFKIFIFPLVVILFVFGGDNSDFNYILKLVGLGFAIVIFSQLTLTWIPILYNSFKLRSFKKAVKKFYLETDKRHVREDKQKIGIWVDKFSFYIYPAILIWIVALMGGRALATGEHKLPTFKDGDGNTSVIIKVYSDEVIIKEMDKATSKLKDGFRIIDIKSVDKVINSTVVNVEDK